MTAPRTMYALAGASWGLVLGAAAAFVAVGYALGFSWLFIFGDDPWPEHVGWAYLAMGVAVFAIVFSLLTVAGYRKGTRLESEGATAGAARRAVLSIAGSAVLGLGLLGTVWLRARADDRGRAARDAQEAALAELLQRRHEVTDWLTETTEEGVAVHLILAGSRHGTYRLMWVLSDGLYGRELLRDSSRLELRPGDRNYSFELPHRVVAERYRSLVLDGGGGVLVENDFPLMVTLAPVLTEAELADLPATERRNLANGTSDLPFVRELSVPLRFTLP